ncbi:hypothetical protein PMAYCL1PPCAC_21704 [Pristionchus mayeri]|uniref:Uncharacterized protein n=1 Tax=Pristionchus mayeri TaxID=1317129 RepID=A0AAN5I4R9_9BILA|nr:hypothetical protein PMAYCL1PPCAC_21704 [Pristionchus mayeri]
MLYSCISLALIGVLVGIVRVDVHIQLKLKRRILGMEFRNLHTIRLLGRIAFKQRTTACT